MFSACKKSEENATLQITSVFPEVAEARDTITIRGVGFPSDLTEVIVKIGSQDPRRPEDKGTPLKVIESKPDQIRAVLPEDINASGLIYVSVGRSRVTSPRQFFGGRIALRGPIVSDSILRAFDPRTGKRNRYLLQGIVEVRGATLTIEKGTWIFGDKSTVGTLWVSTGNIKAEGTADQPIVFTSNQEPGTRKPGDWGGIVIGCGDIEGIASANACQGGGNGNTGSIMQYVRIEYAGVPITPGNEINGISFYNVGRGATFDHIQVSYCGDDSFEWFGGETDAKYLVSLAAVDDDFDTDRGYKGYVQFGLALRDPNIADASQSNGFESDNAATTAVFSHFTYVGPDLMVRGLSPTQRGVTPGILHGRAAQIRRGSRQSFFNSVFIGGHLAGICLTANDITATGTSESPLAYARAPISENIQLEGNVILGTTPALFPTRGGAFAIEATIDRGTDFLEASDPEKVDKRVEVAKITIHSIYTKFYEVPNGNEVYDNEIPGGSGLTTEKDKIDELMSFFGLSGLVSFNQINNPSLALQANSPLVNRQKVKFTKKAESNRFDSSPAVNFRGAFGTENWMEGWTNFNPQVTIY